MKKVKLLVIIGAVVLVAGFTVFADEAKEEVKKATPIELKNQTLCPVMGGEIDSTIYTDIQGQRVYHCCPMCTKDLKADPDKFFKKAGEAGILFENIQTSCPVSGEELESRDFYSDFEGRRVYFCCKRCKGSFNEEPQKFLTKLDPAKEDAVKDSVETKQEKTGHEGHNH